MVCIVLNGYIAGAWCDCIVMIPKNKAKLKHSILLYFSHFFFFSVLCRKRWKNLFNCWKRLFRPTNGMGSTCLLVKIHNSCSLIWRYLFASISHRNFRFCNTKVSCLFQLMHITKWRNKQFIQQYPSNLKAI